MNRCTPSDGSAAACFSAPAVSPALSRSTTSTSWPTASLGSSFSSLRRQRLRPARNCPTQHLHQKGAADQLGRVGIGGERLLVDQFAALVKSRRLLRLAPGQIVAEHAGARQRRRLAGGRLRHDGAPRRPGRGRGQAAQRRPQQSRPTPSRSRIGWPSNRPTPITCSDSSARRRPRVQPNQCFAPGP